jgi:hypothetical protein
MAVKLLDRLGLPARQLSYHNEWSPETIRENQGDGLRNRRTTVTLCNSSVDPSNRLCSDKW